MSSSTPNDNVKDRILREATRLFAAHGYAGTSIQQVAQAAGITRPTLVYHFGGKEKLRANVLAQLLAHWRDDLPRVLTATQRGTDRVRDGLEAVLAFFAADPDRARLLCREMLDRPAEMIDLFAEHLQPWTELITSYIRTGQQGGHVRRQVDPEAWVVQLLLAALAAIATGGATSNIFRDPPPMERQLVELSRIAKVSLFDDRPGGPDGQLLRRQ